LPGLIEMPLEKCQVRYQFIPIISKVSPVSFLIPLASRLTLFSASSTPWYITRVYTHSGYFLERQLIYLHANSIFHSSWLADGIVDLSA
jgi:hypothetical protein